MLKTPNIKTTSVVLVILRGFEFKNGCHLGIWDLPLKSFNFAQQLIMAFLQRGKKAILLLKIGFQTLHLTPQSLPFSIKSFHSLFVGKDLGLGLFKLGSKLRTLILRRAKSVANNKHLSCSLDNESIY